MTALPIARTIPKPVDAPAVAMPSLSRIVKQVERACHLEPNTLYRRSRKSEIARPRHVVFYLARKHLPHLSYPAIASHWAMDHTSVMHGRDQIERAIEGGDSTILYILTQVEAALGAQQ